MHSEVMRLVVQVLELEVESSKIVVELTFVQVDDCESHDCLI